MKLLLLVLSLGFFSARTSLESSGSLLLDIENISSSSGALMIAVFSHPDSFLVEGGECWRKRIEHFSSGKYQVEVQGLPYGEYAVAVYHDQNGNGKLDKNLMGIPTEPYAFSNNPRSKWKRPDFLTSRVEFRSDRLILPISLREWKNY